MKLLVIRELGFIEHNFILYASKNHLKSKIIETFSTITSNMEMKTVLLGENINTTI